MQQRRCLVPVAALLPALFLVLLLGGCAGPLQESRDTPVPMTSTATPLPFETVDRSDYARYTGNFWAVPAPGIAIIAAAADVEELSAFITPESQARLRALDYEADFAVAAFLDSQGCHEPEWGIEQVVLREDELEVYASYPPYEPERGCALAFLLPYHVIRLSRERLSSEITRFTLYLNEEHAVSGSYPPVVTQATPQPEPTPEVTPWPTSTPWPTGTPAATMPAYSYPAPIPSAPIEPYSSPLGSREANQRLAQILPPNRPDAGAPSYFPLSTPEPSNQLENEQLSSSKGMKCV